MRNQQGQALVFSLVLLPTLLLASAVLLRSSEAAFAHYRVQSHIDRLALDTLAIQGEALEALGKLNSYAEKTIHTRRAIEAAQLAGTVGLEVARQALIQTQKLIAAQQRFIKNSTVIKSYELLNKPLPQDLREKVRLSFKPSIIKLHVKNKEGFEDEQGAPLSLEDQFSSLQNIEIHSVAKTHKFLEAGKMQWRKFKDPEDMRIKTYAEIQMEELEGKWKAVLKNKEDN